MTTGVWRVRRRGRIGVVSGEGRGTRSGKKGGIECGVRWRWMARAGKEVMGREGGTL